MTYEKIIKEGGPANSTFLQCEQSINYCNDPKVLGEVYFERVRKFKIWKCQLSYYLVKLKNEKSFTIIWKFEKLCLAACS